MSRACSSTGPAPCDNHTLVLGLNCQTLKALNLITIERRDGAPPNDSRLGTVHSKCRSMKNCKSLASMVGVPVYPEQRTDSNRETSM